MRAGSVEEIIGRTDSDFYPADVAARFKADEDEMIASGGARALRQRAVFADASETWLGSTKAPFRDGAGRLVGIITHSRDISVRKRLEDEKDELQRRLGDALANMADGLAMFDADARIIICNPQYASLFPQTADVRVPGASLADILRAGIARGEEKVPPGTDTAAWIAATVAALRVSADSVFQLGDGRWLEARVRPSADGTSLTVFSEITRAKVAEEALQEMNARLDALARTDGLTGLMNRRAFDEALAHEFSRAARASRPLSVLLVDVDRFKSFNDTYGHQGGDACLGAIAGRLRAALRRPVDIAARYGGEEFVALLPETDAAGALLLAETFRQSVRAMNIPHSGSEKGRVTVTIGVATTGGEAIDSPALLVRRADEALYAGKAAGRDRTFQSQSDAGNDQLRLIAG